MTFARLTPIEDMHAEKLVLFLLSNRWELGSVFLPESHRVLHTVEIVSVCSFLCVPLKFPDLYLHSSVFLMESCDFP